MTLSRRWKHILERLRHRQQIRETYQETRLEKYTTFDNTISTVIPVQILNNNIHILTPNAITVEELILVIGNHYNREPKAFYVTSLGRLLLSVDRLLPGQSIHIIPRLVGKGVGDKRKSKRLLEKTDVTSTLTSLRILVTETLGTLVPFPDRPDPSIRTEGVQELRDQLKKLHQQTQSGSHALREDIRHLVVAAEDMPLQLQELHVVTILSQ